MRLLCYYLSSTKKHPHNSYIKVWFPKRLRCSDKITVKPGVLKRVTDNEGTISHPTRMIFNCDRGVDWYFDPPVGWKRSRVVHACFEDEALLHSPPPLYKVLTFILCDNQVLLKSSHHLDKSNFGALAT